MFTIGREQLVCRIGNFAVGGQPGENPPLLISSMFHNGDKILENRRERKFDHAKAREYIFKQEELTDQTGIPVLVAVVANSLDEMKNYIDFLLKTTGRPFAIDMWVEKTRLQVAEYIASLGIQDRVLYNSITPWDQDIPGQVTRLKELGIRHVVVQAFDQEDQTPGGRVKSMKKMLELFGDHSFASILVDTAVMNLPAISFSCLASRLIKEEFGFPAGVASSNGTYMWKKARELWGSDGFNALNAAGQAIASLLWTDLLFTGPIVNLPRIVPAVATAQALLSTLVFDETGKVTTNENSPMHKFFADFVRQLQ